MERVLRMVEMGDQVGSESLLSTIKIAVLPIAKVFTVCSLGLLMASKYVNILPANGRKLLNGLVFSLLLPCLIFSQLGQSITWEKMLEWWFIPANARDLSTRDGDATGQVPLLTHDENEEEEEQKHEEVVETNPNSSKRSKITEILIFLYDKLKLKQLIQPPIIASEVLAMFLGSVPFFFFTDSCTILGDAMIPCILLALGGNLINGPFIVFPPRKLQSCLVPSSCYRHLLLPALLQVYEAAAVLFWVDHSLLKT